MKTQSIIFSFILCACIFLYPASDVTAVEAAPKISDREIIESLMRLEAGIQANAVAIQANAQAIQANAEAIKVNGEMIGSSRTEMKSDMASLRDEMKSDMTSFANRNEIRHGLLAKRGQISH